MTEKSRDFLESVAGYVNAPTQGPMPSVDRPIRLGTIDPWYTSGVARVLFDGETILSKRGYSWVGSYTPTGGDRVVLVPVGQTYIITGLVTSNIPFPLWLTNGFQNGWLDYDAVNYHAAKMTKSPSGVVRLTGLIRSGSITNNSVIFYLPEDFRPAVDMIFPVMTNGKAGTIAVMADGFVSISQGADNAWLSLDHIIYPTEVLTWNDVTLLNGFGPGASVYDLGTPQWAKDSYNRVWFRGAAYRSTNPAADTAIFNVSSSGRPNTTYHLLASSLGGANNFGLVDFSATGDVRWKANNVTAFIPLGGVVILDQNSGWTTPTMQNSWVNYDSANFSPAGYEKDADGIVYLRGFIKTGTIGSAAYTLPVGSRPSKTILREAATSSGIGRVDIFASGAVVPVSGSNGWFSLDGITFPAEQ